VQAAKEIFSRQPLRRHHKKSIHPSDHHGTASFQTAGKTRQATQAEATARTTTTTQSTKTTTTQRKRKEKDANLLPEIYSSCHGETCQTKCSIPFHGMFAMK